MKKFAVALLAVLTVVGMCSASWGGGKARGQFSIF